VSVALLGRAGVDGVSPRSVVMLSGAWPVAIAFGVMAAYPPVAVVAGRGHKRQREFAEVWPEAVDNLASAVRAGRSLPEALAGPAGPSRCARRSWRSPSTTRLPAGSPTAWTGSRSGWPTRSATLTSRSSGSP